MAIHIPKSRAGNTTPQSIQTNRNTTDKVAAYKKHLDDLFEKGASKPTLSGFEPKKATGLVMPDNQPQVLRAISSGEENSPGEAMIGMVGLKLEHCHLSQSQGQIKAIRR
jgi:hypothetical protein